VACWSTKAVRSLKQVKIEEKLLWSAYRISPTLFRTKPSPTTYDLPFPKIGVRTPPQTSVAIISRTGKATDFKFGRYVHWVHPNKSPLKICEKMERGRIQGVPIFRVPAIIPGTANATDFKFGQYIHRVPVGPN